LFFFTIISLDIGLLPPRRGLNQNRSLVCLMFVRPSQNWNHMILDTLLFVVAEKPIVGTPGRGICNVLFL
jgi:hypothetical protein